MSVLKHGLSHASNGIRIAPLFQAANGHRRLNNWRTLATTDPSIIEQWAANGAVGWQAVLESWVVVDLDVKNNADVFELFLDKLEEAGLDREAWKELPCTRTPSGGWHFWFTGDPERSIGRFEGIDIIDNPNMVGTEGYAWDCPLELGQLYELPAVFRKPAQTASEGAGGLFDDVAEGSRNDALTSYVGGLISEGYPDAQILQMAQAYNLTFKPPLSPSEVQTTTRGLIARYQREQPATPAAPATVWQTPAEIRSSAAHAPPMTELCGPFLAGTVGFIYGDQGTGKSMFCLGLANAIANGVDFGDWTSSQTEVRYVDAELTYPELVQRLDLMGVLTSSILTDSLARRWELECGEFELGAASHQQALIEASSDAQLIIVDNVTFTLTAPDGKSIYDPETVNQLKPLISWARAAGKCLALVDHTNAQGEIFGSKHKAKMANWMLKLKPMPESDADLAFTGEWTKYRGGPTPDPFTAELGPVGWSMERAKTLKEKIRDAIAAGDDPKDIQEQFGKTNYYRYRR